MRTLLLLCLVLLYGLAGITQPVVRLEQVASGFTHITDIAFTQDDRIFVTEQDGTIGIARPNGTVLTTPFLDIDSLVNSSGGEQGLLGLVFHPNYKSNDYFYINYTNNQGNTVIARYSVSSTDSNLADPTSAQILLTVNQPYTNHNAGDLNFGPDGYLYFGLGDGGNGGDPQNRAQNPQVLLGKMLRIDVDGGTPYSIPPDNPFVGDTNVLDEIWDIGMRNPWRFSFDRVTGDMWIGDVGQSQWEEVNLEPAGSPGGVNYGWRCYEGNHSYNSTGCQPVSAYTFPVYEYPHSNGGCSINGGFRYRGAQYGQLYGTYLFSDYCNGWIWGLVEQSPGNWSKVNLLNEEDYELVTFGEDRWGEVYTGKRNKGIVYKIVDTVCQPTAVILAPDTVAFCQGQLLNAVAGENLNYTWYRDGSPIKSSGEAFVGVNQSGVYQVEVERQPGCSALSKEVFVDYYDVLQPTIDTLPLQILLSAAPISLSAIPPGGTFSGPGVTGNMFDPALAGLGTHTIYYNLQTEGGCGGTDSTTITVYKDTGIHPLPEEIIAFEVYPVPATSTLHIRLAVDRPLKVQMTLIDAQGKLVLDRGYSLMQGNTYLTLDRQQIQAGVYFLGVEIHGRVAQKSVVWQ